MYTALGYAFRHSIHWPSSRTYRRIGSTYTTMLEIMHSLVVYAFILVLIYPIAFLLRLFLLRTGGLNESSDDDFEEQPEEHQPEQSRQQAETQLRERPEKQPEEQP